MFRFAGVLALLCASYAAAAAPEPPALEYNPFSRPPSQAIRAVRAPQASGSAPSSSMDLRATLVAHQERLANVGGKILKPGDEIEGFRLLAVFEDRAVFDYKGRPIVMFVRNPPDKADD